MGDRGDRVGVSGDVGVADARCAMGSLAFAFFFDLRREMRRTSVLAADAVILKKDLRRLGSGRRGMRFGADCDLLGACLRSARTVAKPTAVLTASRISRPSKGAHLKASAQ